MWKHKNFINLQLCAGETWVLNADDNTTMLKNTAVNFTSNGQNFKGIAAGAMPSLGPFEIDYYPTTSFQGGTQVKTEDGTWVNDAWRTIIFDEPVTDSTLLTWLQANGVKQSTPKLPTPSNVSITDTTVSWDEVDNATSYDVLVDGEVWDTVVVSSGETWVINESFTDNPPSTQIAFKSNNTQFVKMSRTTGIQFPQTIWYYTNDTEYTVACEYGTWSNEAYRTVTFTTTPTGDLLTWLQANGTKQ